MKTKKPRSSARGDLRPEYDFSKMKGGVRGKYAARYDSGTNLVLLSPDVAAHFPSERSVNEALRSMIRSGKRSARKAH